MSQIYKTGSGGGGGGITTINTDDGSVTGPVIDLLANKGNKFAGSSVSFVAASPTEVDLIVTDASLNTIIGEFAGFSIVPTPGAANTGLGYSALFGLTTGEGNIGIGQAAMSTLVDGLANTCVGASAGPGGGASNNVAIGNNCMTGSSAVTPANDNVAVGYSALGGLGDGNGNVAVGSLSLGSSDNPKLVTAIGYNSLNSNSGSPGDYNTAIGANTGTNYNNGEASNILIGSSGVASDANVIRIGTQGTGNAQQSTCFIAGITGATVTGTAVLCSTSGQLGTVVSSLRYKENVKEIAEDVSVLNLKPVEFNYKVDANKNKQFGLIAEDVHKDFPSLCFYNDDGEPESVKYHELPVFLLKEIQRLNDRITELENKLNKKFSCLFL